MATLTKSGYGQVEPNYLALLILKLLRMELLLSTTTRAEKLILADQASGC